MLVNDINRFKSAWGVKRNSIALISDVSLPTNPAYTLKGIETADPMSPGYDTPGAGAQTDAIAGAMDQTGNLGSGLSGLGDETSDLISSLSWQTWVLVGVGGWLLMKTLKQKASNVATEGKARSIRFKRQLKEAGTFHLFGK